MAATPPVLDSSGSMGAGIEEEFACRECTDPCLYTMLRDRVFLEESNMRASLRDEAGTGGECRDVDGLDDEMPSAIGSRPSGAGLPLDALAMQHMSYGTSLGNV